MYFEAFGAVEYDEPTKQAVSQTRPGANPGSV